MILKIEVLKNLKNDLKETKLHIIDNDLIVNNYFYWQTGRRASKAYLQFTFILFSYLYNQRFSNHTLADQLDPTHSLS